MSAFRRLPRTALAIAGIGVNASEVLERPFAVAQLSDQHASVDLTQTATWLDLRVSVSLWIDFGHVLQRYFRDLR
jgi:hypothetical protein